MDADVSALAARVRLLERKIDMIMQHLGLQYTDDVSKEVPPDVIDWVRRGNIIEAIKAYREYSGLGLKEAKDVIDELTARHKQGLL
jgi:ribosomal protein L7/L12